MDINITLIGQMITFIIFVGFTMKFVWPPLKKAMDERRSKITDGLAAADGAKKELEIAKNKAQKLINEAKLQATKIVNQAKNHAVQIDEQMKEAARIDAEKIRKAANDEAAAHMVAIKQKLQKEVVDIAIISAEKLLGKNIDVAANSHLLEKMAAKL